MITLECNYSKKIGLPGYSSHQFSITLKTEIIDLNQVQPESARLYSLLQTGVDSSIKDVGFLPANEGNGSPKAKPNGNGNGNGNGHSDAWNCSDKQRDLILKIVEENRLDKKDIEALAKERFNVGVKALNKLQASGLIDELLEKYGGKKSSNRRYSQRSLKMIAQTDLLENKATSPTNRTIQELTQTVSASRLILFHSCRLKFFFRYVQGLRKPKDISLFVGGVVHLVLQTWNKARWRKIQMTLDSLRLGFDQHWVKEQEEEQVVWEQGEEAPLKDHTWTLLDTYFKATPIQASEKVEAVEVPVEADLTKHGLPTLIGVFDLVHEGGKIVDFKTAGQTPNPDRALHLHETQLSCYGVLYREATSRRESGFELHHLVKLKTPKLVVTAVPTMTDSQQSRLFRLMESYLEGVQGEDWLPNPNPMTCACCEYFQECRSWV